jgi:hypothetical protein
LHLTSMEVGFSICEAGNCQFQIPLCTSSTPDHAVNMEWEQK